jgi:phosphomannomutase
MNTVREAALAWLADDPDPASREELAALIDALPASSRELADRFSGPLTFGTAGLRGKLRAGPNGMNLAVVRRAAAGLAAWLGSRDVPGPVVIGYDARHGSEAFALQTARVVAGSGRQAFLLPRPLPTPVLAHAVLRLGAVAGVMVTASHNPPEDNGYKVYLGRQLGGAGGGGAQLAPPMDVEIAAAIDAVGPLATVPLSDDWERLGDEIVASYLAGAAAVLSGKPLAPLTVAYTALHGVGTETFLGALRCAGLPDPVLVAEQAGPDPTFPTVTFPNPEEPGAMDRLLALAASSGADLAIAHDPDADRCAVAVPVRPSPEPATPASAPAAAGWRMLRGDELGVLLADHLMRRGVSGRFAASIASSTLLSRLCAARGMPYSETLTGFKWLVRAGEDLVFAYEEALGYCVAPAHVRDKDGITAALLAYEIAATLKAAGKTVLDRLDELALELGVHVTDQLSVRVDDLSEIVTMMATVRRAPIHTLLGEPVTTLTDLLPRADVVVARTSTARVVLRPSGTEPKLKAYLEVAEPAGDGDLAAAHQRAAQRLSLLRKETATLLGL